MSQFMADQISNSNQTPGGKFPWFQLWRIINVLLALVLLVRLVLHGQFEDWDNAIIVYGCMVGILQGLYKRGEFEKILYFFKRDDK
jgi:hypothetical protein